MNKIKQDTCTRIPTIKLCIFVLNFPHCNAPVKLEYRLSSSPKMSPVPFASTHTCSPTSHSTNAKFDIWMKPRLMLDPIISPDCSILTPVVRVVASHRVVEHVDATHGAREQTCEGTVVASHIRDDWLEHDDVTRGVFCCNLASCEAGNRVICWRKCTKIN